MPQPRKMKLDPIRKAAILISTLDHRVADELLDRMTEEHAALVRNAALEIDDIPKEEQDLVLQEFLGTNQSVDAVDDSGIELDEELARKLAAGESFAAPVTLPSEHEEPPFRFLREAETDAIAKHLLHENPQIIAVVIAHLPPSQAAELLKHFEAPLQANLLRRISELDATDRDIVRDVEKHLKLLLHDELQTAKHRAIGLSTVASILTAAGDTQDELISSLTQHDRQLAIQLQQPSRNSLRTNSEEANVAIRQLDTDPPTSREDHSGSSKKIERAEAQQSSVTFEDLAQISDGDLAMVFRESDSKLALLALAGASPQFVERLLRQLPTREAKRLRRRMEQLGPLRLSDIEQAQMTIAATAARLMETGLITGLQSDRFAVAA